MHKVLIEDLWQLLKLPDDYKMRQRQAAIHDEFPIMHYRFTKNNKLNYGGEHVSFTINRHNNLQGLMVMDASLQCGTLPSEVEAREITCQFISAYAPDLNNDLELKWVAEHEEIIRLEGKDIVISGMKVKCRIKSTGKFAWVIVGKNRLPITFERDIVWNYDMSERQTEKWLHDSWLQQEAKKHEKVS